MIPSTGPQGGIAEVDHNKNEHESWLQSECIEGQEYINKNFSEVMRTYDKAKKRAVRNTILADERVNSSQSAMCRVLSARCC